MNIPALKCARGYHKRGRKFKVLYFCSFFYNVMPIVVLRNKGNHFRDVVINRKGEKRIYLISIWDYSACFMLKMNQSDC